MITEDQSEVVAFLASPSTHGGAAVERIDTHASIVFLAGTRAWKLKRAVRYDYLDFSTVERRRAMCEAEVQINRRTAPAVYRVRSQLRDSPMDRWRLAARPRRWTGSSRWTASIRTDFSIGSQHEERWISP
jgi:hypothetical protein